MLRASLLPLSAGDLHLAGRLGPSTGSSSLGQQRAAEAALGTSPPALNGTFVGEPGGSHGLAGTHSALVLETLLQLGWDVGLPYP